MSIPSANIRAYLAGFLDGDGSIYVQLKPNSTYRYGFQIAPYIVFFQSSKDKPLFEKLCSLVGFGYIRERKDGILEYIIGKNDNIKEFLFWVSPFLVLKKRQAELMINILNAKESVDSRQDFKNLIKLIDTFRELNYSKKRKIRTLTP